MVRSHLEVLASTLIVGRMVALECSVDDIPNLDKLAGRLNGRIPSGGSGKGGLEISRQELDEIISREVMQWSTWVMHTMMI